MKAVWVALMSAVVITAAGCGGKSESEKESEAAKEGRGTITCEGKALSGSSGLPANFPHLDGVTYVNAQDKGPTHVVDAYSDESLKGLYNEYKERLKEEQFTILFDELEDKDSEISYKTKDGATEGQIALRDTCDNGNVSVHITARPS
jgi:hypothetical protein